MAATSRASSIVLALLFTAGSGLLAGCDGESDPVESAPTDGPAGPMPDCDPLVPSQCGYPFPSNYYLADDSSTVTGKRVAFGPTSLPWFFGDFQLDPAPWQDSDGFSPNATLLADMPGATAAGLPTQHDIDLSLSADSPTVLIEAETGERVPHFSELDVSASSSDDDRALEIRPVRRLRDGTRYIVAVRAIADAAGAALAPSPAFRSLRDGTASNDFSVVGRRALYADIFGRLESAGVARGDLQLAWDFTTASRENNTRWMLHMRDDALAKVGDEGPEYSIVSVEEDPNPNIRRRILGRMTVPFYLDHTGPGGTLVFGDDGLPKQNGTAEFEFLVHVPHSATTGSPCALLQNGHGLLGKKTEGQDGYLATLANEKQFVAFAVDFAGFSDEDYDEVVASLAADFTKFKRLIGRQHQGMLNSLLAMRMMKGRFTQEPLVQFNGASAIDPTEAYYRGDSQGGIYGVTYMALSTDVTRGLLGEPGMPYVLLLNRSVDFAPFFDIGKLAFGTSRDLQLALGLVQMWWDRTEPGGYAPYITRDTLPGTPEHEVLLHVAIGDYQVTPLGAHLIAREIGAKNLAPVNRSIWGIEEASAPFEGSGIVEFDFGLPDAPDTNNPPTGPDEDDPHDKVRVLDVAHDQTDVFLRTGKVQAFCDGPCDPE